MRAPTGSVSVTHNQRIFHRDQWTHHWKLIIYKSNNKFLWKKAWKWKGLIVYAKDGHVTSKWRIKIITSARKACKVKWTHSYKHPHRNRVNQELTKEIYWVQHIIFIKKELYKPCVCCSRDSHPKMKVCHFKPVFLSSVEIRYCEES